MKNCRPCEDRRAQSAVFFHQVGQSGKRIDTLGDFLFIAALQTARIGFTVLVRRKKIERQNKLLFNPVRHIELGGTHHDLVIAVIFNGQTVGFVFGFRKEKRHFLVDFYLKGLAATGTVGRKLGFDRKQCTCPGDGAVPYPLPFQ